MSDSTSKTGRKRGQRRNNIEIPQGFLDRLTPSVFENPYYDEKEEVTKGQFSSEPSIQEVLTLDKLFSRYYAAREAAGAAERTLQDYRKHMNWLKRFMASEYGGLDNFVPILISAIAL